MINDFNYAILQLKFSHQIKVRIALLNFALKLTESFQKVSKSKDLFQRIRACYV